MFGKYSAHRVVEYKFQYFALDMTVKHKSKTCAFEKR